MLKSQDVRRFQERLKTERDAIESRIATNKHGIQETVQDESGVGDSGDESNLLYEREAEIDENSRDQKELAQVNARSRSRSRAPGQLGSRRRGARPSP